MNWIQKNVLGFVQKAKDTFKRIRPSKKEQAESLWLNCPGCKELKLKTDLEPYMICSCNYHFDLSPRVRFSDDKLLWDNGVWEEIKVPSWSDPDPYETVINGKKYIDKYKGYQKKTGQQTALLVGYGKISGLRAVCVNFNFAFGGGAFGPSESEHLIAGIQYAMDNKVDLFLTIYQSGGMQVTQSLISLAGGMPKQMVAMKELKKAGILTVGIISGKTSGGTYASMVYANDVIGIENPSADNILFSGLRVSKNVNSGQVIPDDFGKSQGVMKSGLADFCLGSRLELKDTVSNLAKVLLKKGEQQPISSSVEIDESSENQIDRKIIKA
ncbi:MAG: carboxyl transferase domain-containing protein [Pelagibacteraceae bacterium]